MSGNTAHAGCASKPQGDTRAMEIEAKFSVLSKETRAALGSLTQLAGYDLTVSETLQLRDCYLDTADRRMFDAGYAFRRRLQNGHAYLSLKSLGGASGSIHRREELEVDAQEAYEGLEPDAWPEGDLRHQILEMVNDGALTSLFTVEQERVLRHVVDVTGSEVADIAIDDVTIILEDGHTRQRFVELEIELNSERPESDLERILDALTQMPGLVPQPTSKFERGLALVERADPDGPKRIKVRSKDTFGRALSKILVPLFLKMQDHEQGSYAGVSTEELHDMRVATRRMRTAFWVAEPYLNTGALKPIKQGLARTAEVLGAVRDMDVFREKTEAYLAEHATQISGYALLLRVWDVEYIRRRNEMLGYLSGKKYAKFKKAFWAALQDDLPERKRVKRVTDLVPTIIRERLNTVQDHGSLIGASELPLATYHELRIDVKRLRYALEFFHAVLGPPALEAIEALKVLQDFFGDLQDARVAATHLHAVIDYGTWEAPKQIHALWSADIAGNRGRQQQVSTALDQYLLAQEGEIEAHIARAPAVWQAFQDSGAPQMVRDAIGTLSKSARVTSLTAKTQKTKPRRHLMTQHPTYVILMGPPASGKGTQADRLQELLSLPHVASGDLFRYNLKNETELGLKAKGYMERGELVPDDITIAMVLDRLARPDCGGGALLDGFPRTEAQAEALDNALAEQGRGIDLVLNIQVPRDELIARVTGRRLCRDCGASYHVKFMPPAESGVCDKCSGELYQRDDDTEATAVKRLEVYEDQTKPLIAYYGTAGILANVDGDQSVDEVTEALKSEIEANL
jgi:adenylate kinase